MSITKMQDLLRRLGLTGQGMPGSPMVQQPSDWSASSGVTRILNKPAIPAAGIPPGGASGQVLAKTSGSDYAADWVTPAAGSGGGAPVIRRVTVTANSIQGIITLVGFGTSGELAAATVTPAADGSSVTVAGLASTFKLSSVSAVTPAGFNTGTAFSVVFPDPWASADLDNSALAILMHYNTATPAIEQAQTNIGISIAAGVITLIKTGLVAGTAARWKALIH